MKRLFILSAAFTFSASMAMAAITANDLVSAYQAKGYTRIEVVTGLTQIKVEAVRGTSKVEAIYDSATGTVLLQETGFVRRKDRAAGVEMSSSSTDFTHGSGDDDGFDDDMDGDDDGPNHDANDDHGGDDHGNDDHGGDDHGGDDHANDDHANDDHGGDDHGKDDRGKAGNDD